jgi:outer membrane protein TolC
LTILLSQFQAAVSLYKALGGGWQVGSEMAVATKTP